MKDFKEILGEDFDYSKWNEGKSTYSFGLVKIEFFSADDDSKLRGARRNILFINECNNINKMAFNELDTRTFETTFLDFNPVDEFWAHEMKGFEYVEWIHSTYLDAVQFLTKENVDKILRRKNDKNWWRVYGLGLVGKIEGLIHPNFTTCKLMPSAGREIYGMDFGYTNDPTTLIYNRIVDETLYSKELIYETGMKNNQIIKRFEMLGIQKGYDVIIADKSAPKDIDEIHDAGYDIRPSQGGPGSIEHGIQKVNQYNQVWTEDSVNCIKEQRNYRYEKDKNGKFTQKPMDDWNHGQDSRRYAVEQLPDAKVYQYWNKVEIIRKGKKPKLPFYQRGITIHNVPSQQTAILFWYFNSYDMLLWFYDEYFSDDPFPDEHAVKIWKILKGKKPHFAIGNDEMFGKDEEEDALKHTLASEYAKEKIYLTPASSNRFLDAKISRSSSWMKNRRICVSATCPNIITQAQKVIWSANGRMGDQGNEACIGIANTVEHLDSKVRPEDKGVDQRYYEWLDRGGKGKFNPRRPPRKVSVLD